MMRRAKAALYVLAALAIIYIIHPTASLGGPRYPEWKEEDALRVQEGARMVRFDTPQGHGLSVQLQTLILQHHLALITNRSLAYSPILLQPRQSIPLLSHLFSGLGISRPYAHLPLSAFVASFSSGFETLQSAPPAIPLTAPKVRTACGKTKAQMVDFQTPYNPEGSIVPEGEGMGLVHQMQMEIGKREGVCVWVKGNVLDYSFYQSPAPIDILPSLLTSPVLAHYTPSRRSMELINLGLQRLDPEVPLYSIDSILGSSASPSPRLPKAGTLRSLLVLHLPAPSALWRGTCDIAAEHRLPFYGFNKLTPALPGNEGVPPPESMSVPAVHGLYTKKCRPPILDIIQRARRLRKNHPLLKSVYVVTDPEKPKKEPPVPGSTSSGGKEPQAHKWSDEVRMWLESEGWEHVWIGRDDVWAGDKSGEGVDLEVARRAGVFVGNGFSPFASNVVLFRQRDALHRDLTQFW